MRVKFTEFILAESTAEKKIVFSFGRFQPPTIGHKLLVDKVVSLAKKYKADHVIYASKTQDSKSNPLKVDTKVKYLRKMFSGVNFEPANEEVRTFIEALKKLYSQGYKHVFMVAGSDRLADYQKLFDKYNGGEDFAFITLQAVSAGERDPDAEGAAGMSGTKMRQAAFNNDFAAFRTGIPSSLSDADARKLMGEIRRSRPLKEFVEYSSAEVLEEGINDKSIFKAVFLAGGPGSGKDFILKKTLAGHGLTEINSDNALEYLMDKYDLDKKMPESEEQQRNALRSRAKSVTELKERLAIHGRNGLIINGTGDDSAKIAKIKARLEGLGYDTKLMLVNTKNEVSQRRNIERGERGGRTVPENIRLEKWTAVQNAKEDLKDIFGPDNYHEIDNSEDLRTAGQDVKNEKEAELMDYFKMFRKFTETPPESEEANQWINTQRQITKSLAANPRQETDPAVAQDAPAQQTTQTMQQPAAQIAAAPQTQTGQPAPATALQTAQQTAMDKARKMGLEYYGFGRFGKDGHTTHKEVNGDLKELNPLHEQFKEAKTPEDIAKMHKVRLIDIIKQLKMGVKVEKEHTTSKEMARKIALQHLAEIPDYYTRLKKVESKPLKEAYEFSGSDAMSLLTLGKPVVEEKRYDAKCVRVTESFLNRKTKKESYDSPSAESPGVFGYSKDDWKKGKTSVSELTGDVELTTTTFQQDDQRKKMGLEPFTTFKSKNPI
jgi:phosphopantetheine adenylyltransferase